MAFILTVDQAVPVSVTFADEHGNATTVDGLPVWSSSDDTVVMVTADDTGMSAMVTAVGPLGQAQVSLTADARMGDEVVSVIGLLDIEVVPGEAVKAVLTAGSAIPKPVVNPLTP